MPKKYNHKLQVDKSWAKQLRMKKSVHKMLVKLTLGVKRGRVKGRLLSSTKESYFTNVCVVCARERECTVCMCV